MRVVEHPRRGGGPEREQERLVSLASSSDERDDHFTSTLDERIEHCSEDASSLPRTVLVDERSPEHAEGITEITEQLGDHLAYRLRLVRQLAQVVPVVDRPTAEALTRMSRTAVGADQLDL